MSNWVWRCQFRDKRSALHECNLMTHVGQGLKKGGK